jgi:DNA-binding GntR family transcriptional regulator
MCTEAEVAAARLAYARARREDLAEIKRSIDASRASLQATSRPPEAPPLVQAKDTDDADPSDTLSLG